MSDQRVSTVLEGHDPDRSELGGKGAALDRLIGWGLPVPPTAVVTTGVSRQLQRSPGVARLMEKMSSDDGDTDVASVDSVFASADLPADTVASILETAREVGGDGRLAFRSSATVEDLAASSFAGQYRSVLDVDPHDEAAVLDAVRAVLASLWHPAPRAYRAAFGIDEAAAAMAVVVMRMVPARRAGVVFTEDPAGRPNAARVEIVSGFGESLVSGEVTPDAHVVDRDEGMNELESGADAALRCALEIEERAGCPQDVEWAWDGERTWIVQARPITVHDRRSDDGFDSAPTTHELTTAGIGEMLPGVIPPLIWQLSSHLVNEAFARILGELAALPEDPAGTRHLVLRVHGRAALDFDALRGVAGVLPGGAEQELEQQYFGSKRSGRAVAEAAPGARRRQHLVHDLRVTAARRRIVGDADAVNHARRQLAVSPSDPERLDDGELWARRSRLIDLGVRAMGAELGAAAVAAATFRRLELTLLPHLGAERSSVAAGTVTAAARVSSPPDPRASSAIFAGPTWQERGVSPAVIDSKNDAADAMSQLEAELKATPTWPQGELRRLMRTTALRRLVADTTEHLHRREATKATVLSVGGEVRRIHLEIGRRLVERGLLDDGEAVDLLSESELRGALGGVAVPTATLARRSRWLEQSSLEGPLPARFRGVPHRNAPALPKGNRLEGWATSPGRATGVAHTVAGPDKGLVDGGVLVVEATDASWSPLFVRASAIVLERGGPLSHAAILARELGVPAVLNVADATRVLDGKRVLVDGDAGVVVILDDGHGGES